MNFVEAGDLLLFKSSGKWYEKIIVWATKGDYVHVAIAIDSTHMVAATRKGIVISYLLGLDFGNEQKKEIMLVRTSHYTEEDELADGLTWAASQVGMRYGWIDILFQALKFLAPNNPLRFGRVDEWDCSDFATRYLQQAGVILPMAFCDPYANTPNDIARLFGLVPPRTEKTGQHLPLVPRTIEEGEDTHGKV